MTHRSLALAALVTLAAPVGAQPARPRTTPTRSRPAPAARPTEAAKPAASATAAVVQALADVDVAFSKRAGSGLRDAMLATYADDAIVFQPRAIRARPWIASSTPPAGQTTWAPAWSAVSGASELGVTTGPIAFHSTAPDSTANGQYVTVWTRAGTDWKALVHLEIPGPAPTATVPFLTHLAAGDGRPRGGPGAAEAVRATLFIADRGLAAASMTDGPGALARIVVPDAHVVRDGTLPFIGPDSIRAGLAARDARLGGRLHWEVEEVRVSRSGDMGVTYGVYERRGAADAIIESGDYLRVWERQPDGGWRVLLDAATPLRP